MYKCSYFDRWVWCEAAAQPKLEEGLGIGGFGYPVSLLFPWVKVFRINPEFRILRLTFFSILRLTFHRNSASKC